MARLAQSVERQTLNLKVVGSTPTSGSSFSTCCFRLPVLGYGREKNNIYFKIHLQFC